MAKSPRREWCTTCNTLPIHSDTHDCKKHLKNYIRVYRFTIRNYETKILRLQEKLDDLEESKYLF